MATARRQSYGSTFAGDEELAVALEEADGARFNQFFQRINRRRGLVERRIEEIWDRAKWADARRIWDELEPIWQQLQQKFHQAGRQEANQGGHQARLTTFREAEGHLNKLESRLQSHLQVASVPVSLQISEDALAAKIAAQVKTAHDEAVAAHEATRKSLNEAVQRIDTLKRETVLASSFGAHVRALKKNAIWSERGFLLTFVMLLGALPLINVGYFPNAPATLYDLYQRLAVSGPIVVLAYFAFQELKFTRLARLRYENLEGFISGGATEIAQMLVGPAKDPKEATAALNARLAEILLNIDDLAAVTRRAGLPTKELQRFVVELRKLFEVAHK